MIYTIKKGKHTRDNRFFKLWFGKSTFEFSFTILDGWYKQTDVPIHGINKLYGVSFGTHAENPLGKIPVIKNLVNSFLLGWQPDFNTRDKFNIYGIQDNRGVEIRPYLFSCMKGEEVTVKIIRKKGRVAVTINNSYFFLIPLNTLPFGYYLFPYFGGKSVAPCDVVIAIEN